MSELTLNINDYLSDQEKTQIAREAFREAAAQQARKDFERILSNAAYHMVGEIVDQHFDGGMVETLKTNAIKVINNLSSTTVFSPPNAWDRASSKGFDHLQTAVDELKPAIHERVAKVIAGYSSTELRELIEAQVGEAIIKKLSA
ncbi:hypothetical protein [Pseudomonas sp. Irchel 3A18]|uniref:hypothetical protein n=1 Tax=Pseudomonas sp. Irchel 3A18 TaxID=2008905 RepID=UPI000BA4506D|nr:hypothetical protein [Pseudomonas sp. Irchel 3A18]